MQNKLLFILILVFILCRTDYIYGQHAHNAEMRYHIGYFGNTFINPGLSFQLESTFKTKYIHFLSRSFATEYIGNATVAGYWDPFAHTGLHYFIDYSRRLYLIPEMSVQAGAGLGWLMIFLPESYTINDSGKIRKSMLNSHGFVAPHISGGWRITNKKAKRSIGSRILIHFPWRYNLYTIPIISYELSYQF